MSSPQKIDSIIPLIFEQEYKWKYQLLSNWQNIFGKMSDKLYLERINDDTLVLAVYDACWMQELYTLSPLLITTINKIFDKPYINHLKFKRAGIRKKKEPFKKHEPYITKQMVYHLTAREEKALASVKDEQLAQALRDFLMRCYQERQAYKTEQLKTLDNRHTNTLR
jgi:hypothetical protein